MLLFRDRDSLKRLIDQNDLESYERYYGNPWADFDARYIVLVTDASAREAGDPLSSTGLDVAGIDIDIA